MLSACALKYKPCVELRQAACIVGAIWIAVQLIGLAVAYFYGCYSAVIVEYHVAIARLYPGLYIRRGLYDLSDLADDLIALLMCRILLDLFVVHLVYALNIGILVGLMLEINGGGPCGVALGGGYNSLINTDLGGLYGKAESAGV